MASEHGDPEALPAGIEEWVAERTEETGESRETVLARAVAAYRLLTEDEDGEEALGSRLSELEARLDELEAGGEPDRLDELEHTLDEHVEDLRTRIVKVAKETRTRAPEDHDHEELTERLDDHEEVIERLDERADDIEALDETVAELSAEFSELDGMVEDRLGVVEGELGGLSESVETVESKADRLAGAVVDLRRRVERIERHVSHQTALAELLETAAREDIEKARCGSCGELVKLPLLVEPACPHCRSVFNSIEPGSLFFKSASLTVADRPALEAGSTTEQPFDGEATAGGSGRQPSSDRPPQSQDR